MTMTTTMTTMTRCRPGGRHAERARLPSPETTAAEARCVPPRRLLRAPLALLSLSGWWKASLILFSGCLLLHLLCHSHWEQDNQTLARLQFTAREEGTEPPGERRPRSPLGRGGHGAPWGEEATELPGERRPWSTLAAVSLSAQAGDAASGSQGALGFDALSSVS